MITLHKIIQLLVYLILEISHKISLIHKIFKKISKHYAIRFIFQMIIMYITHTSPDIHTAVNRPANNIFASAPFKTKMQGNNHRLMLRVNHYAQYVNKQSMNKDEPVSKNSDCDWLVIFRICMESKRIQSIGTSWLIWDIFWHGKAWDNNMWKTTKHVWPNLTPCMYTEKSNV